MKTRSILFLPVLFVVLACNPKPATDNNQAVADSLINGLAKAIASGNLESTMNYMSDDILVFDMGKSFASKDSLKAHMEPLMQYYENFTFHPGLTAVKDNLITYHGLLTLDWSMDSVPQPVRGLITLVWQKQTDNQWKLILESLEFGMLPKK